MKITELRIGNIVWNDYSGQMIINAIMQSKHNSFVDLVKNESLPSGRYSVEDISGIPLTEEWLKKFGFTGWDLGYYTLLMDSGVFAILTEDGMTIVSRNIKYVHQHQNLYFTLTSQELNANNE